MTKVILQAMTALVQAEIDLVLATLPLDGGRRQAAGGRRQAAGGRPWSSDVHVTREGQAAMESVVVASLPERDLKAA